MQRKKLGWLWVLVIGSVLLGLSFFWSAFAQPCPTGNQGFRVTASGFTDPAGRPWSMRGVNIDTWTAMPLVDGMLRNYPTLTAVRGVAVADRQTPESLDELVFTLTGRGIFIVLEDHGDSQGGRNIDWYVAVAKRYKDNPLVGLETPNEPKPEMTGQPQADIINAVRDAGFTNPIGIQPIGGWDQANIPVVLAGVKSRDNLYIDMHVYCDSGPQCATGWANAVSGPSNGLFQVVGEFGDALDGYTRNPYGLNVITAIVDVVSHGKAGGTFWHIYQGHPDGADSACADGSCNGLTITGNMLKPILASGGQSACPMNKVAGAITTPQAQATQDQAQSEIDSLTKTADDLLSQVGQSVSDAVAKIRQRLTGATPAAPLPQEAPAAQASVPVARSPQAAAEVSQTAQASPPVVQSAPLAARVAAQPAMQALPAALQELQAATQALQAAQTKVGSVVPTEGQAPAVQPSANTAPTEVGIGQQRPAFGQKKWRHDNDGDADDK